MFRGPSQKTQKWWERERERPFRDGWGRGFLLLRTRQKRIRVDSGSVPYVLVTGSPQRSFPPQLLPLGVSTLSFLSTSSPPRTRYTTPTPSCGPTCDHWDPRLPSSDPGTHPSFDPSSRFVGKSVSDVLGGFGGFGRPVGIPTVGEMSRLDSPRGSQRGSRGLWTRSVGGPQDPRRVVLFVGRLRFGRHDPVREAETDP